MAEHNVIVPLDRLCELGNELRGRLQEETATCCEGGAVAALLLITFALDHTDCQLDERVEPYCQRMIQQMLETLRNGTLGVTPSSLQARH